MSNAAMEPEHGGLAAGHVGVIDAGPLGILPHLSRRRARIEGRVVRLATGQACRQALRRLDEALGTSLEAERPELLWRASGLLRPGLVARLARRSSPTRMALGIETPLGHAIVDRLLGFERSDAETRRQLTPVEWGVLTFLIARTLDDLTRGQGSPVPEDLVLDRVGPDPLDPDDLGSIVTLRWFTRVGPVTGSIRLWLSEALLLSVPARMTAAAEIDPGLLAHPKAQELEGEWHAWAGTVSLPRGLASLRAGVVLPLDRSPLAGTPQSPTGTVSLELSPAGGGGRCWFACEAVPQSGGGRLILNSTLRRDPTPAEADPVNPSSESAESPGPSGPSPGEVPVTLAVELGRVNLTLARLADLKPGDVIELARHSREPVELTSGGRLVARGELVQIDTELGVRVTQVFL